MDTIRNYIDWMNRVRTLDPDRSKLFDWHRKRRDSIADGEERRFEEEATDLERALFLSPPNPAYGIQEFENGNGLLIAKNPIGLFAEQARQSGLIEVGDHTGKGHERVKSYWIGGSDTRLYIAEPIGATRPKTVMAGSGKLGRYQIEKPYVELWTDDSRNLGACHDAIQPFLELVEDRGIPSLVTGSRSSVVMATNVPELLS